MSKESDKEATHSLSTNAEESVRKKKTYSPPRLVSHGEVKKAVVMSPVSEVG